MNICPECGGPISEGQRVISEKDVECPRCDWRGVSNETIYVDDAVAGVQDARSQLEELYQAMASEVAPHIGKLLISRNLVMSPDGTGTKEDTRRIRFLAKILQAATRGALEGIASAIAQEINCGRN